MAKRRHRDQGHPARRSRPERPPKGRSDPVAEAFRQFDHPLAELAARASEMGNDQLDVALEFCNSLIGLEETGHIEIRRLGSSKFKLVPVTAFGQEAIDEINGGREFDIR